MYDGLDGVRAFLWIGMALFLAVLIGVTSRSFGLGSPGSDVRGGRGQSPRHDRR